MRRCTCIPLIFRYSPMVIVSLIRCSSTTPASEAPYAEVGLQVSSLERGQKASAELRLRGLGSLQQASLRLENATCGWHLEAVTVLDAATGDRWECSKWCARFTSKASATGTRYWHAGEHSGWCRCLVATSWALHQKKRLLLLSAT